MATLYFKSRKSNNGVLILLADDDQEYRNSNVVVECEFETWIDLWRDFQGLAVMILDSEILEPSGRFGGLKPENDLGRWCKGKNILEKLEQSPNERVIIVLSGGAGTARTPISKWYTKSRVLDHALQKIEDLATKTKNGQMELGSWPPELGDDEEDLSQVIHALHNLFQPLAWDVETLGTLIDTPNRESIAEIYTDYFAPTTSAYLSSQSKRHKGTDILHHVDEVCELLPQKFGNSIKAEKEAVTKSIISGQEALGKQDFSASLNLLSAKNLQDALAAIANAGASLESVLRKLRETKYGSNK